MAQSGMIKDNDLLLKVANVDIFDLDADHVRQLIFGANDSSLSQALHLQVKGLRKFSRHERCISLMRDSTGCVGLMFSRDVATQRYVVYNLLPKSSASTSQLIRIGDVIRKIDGHDVDSLTIAEISRQLQGEPGSRVEVTVAYHANIFIIQ